MKTHSNSQPSERAVNELFELMASLTPLATLESFKALMTREFGVDFNTHHLIVAENFANEIGLTIPPNIHVHITPFLSGRMMGLVPKAASLRGVDARHVEEHVPGLSALKL